MKILLDHHVPFALAHGGLQVQIEQTHRALAAAGVDVEYLRWWDDSQRADLIHYFGRPATAYLRRAQEKGVRFVFSELLGGMGARRPAALLLQRLFTRALDWPALELLSGRMNWAAFREADACIALTPWEAHLMRTMFRAPARRVTVIPNGVEDVFLQPHHATRGEWLVTTASILPVKRIVETATAAVAAATPYWVVGRPFSEDDPYYRAFREIQRAHPKLIRYEGPVADRADLARIYREARGFVMMSRWESLSVSALEAAACGAPLLLTDLPWARSVFGDSVQFWKPGTDLARALRAFYDAAPRLPPPTRPLHWREVADQLRDLYARVLSSSR